jgi:toxin ParE1/3/4
MIGPQGIHLSGSIEFPSISFVRTRKPTELEESRRHMGVRYRAAARADIESIRQYIEKRMESGAARVLRSIYMAIRFIAQYPRASETTDDPDLHLRLVMEYRYKIFYKVLDETIEVLHVRHTGRRPWGAEDQPKGTSR